MKNGRVQYLKYIFLCEPTCAGVGTPLPFRSFVFFYSKDATAHAMQKGDTLLYLGKFLSVAILSLSLFLGYKNGSDRSNLYYVLQANKSIGVGSILLTFLFFLFFFS